MSVDTLEPPCDGRTSYSLDPLTGSAPRVPRSWPPNCPAACCSGRYRRGRARYSDRGRQWPQRLVPAKQVLPRNLAHPQLVALRSIENLAGFTGVGPFRLRGCLKHPLIFPSNSTEDFTVYALLHEHLCRLLDQWTQPVLGPIGNMFVVHQSLSKQRMRARLDRVRLQHIPSSRQPSQVMSRSAMSMSSSWSTTCWSITLASTRAVGIMKRASCM